jgi:hypothetical protein
MGDDFGTGLWGVAAQRSGELQQLAARLVICEARAEEVFAGFWDIQMSQWQSPAGQAYRNQVSLQAVAMRRILDCLQEAAAVVNGHARAVLTSECSSGGTS